MSLPLWWRDPLIILMVLTLRPVMVKITHSAELGSDLAREGLALHEITLVE